MLFWGEGRPSWGCKRPSSPLGSRVKRPFLYVKMWRTCVGRRAEACAWADACAYPEACTYMDACADPDAAQTGTRAQTRTRAHSRTGWRCCGGLIPASQGSGTGPINARMKGCFHPLVHPSTCASPNPLDDRGARAAATAVRLLGVRIEISPPT